jgi:polysaccharide biosynthesis transport protein
LQEPLRGMLAARQVQHPNPTGSVLHGADGRPLAAAEISRTVLFGAYDAGLDRPQEVTAEALRYTYLIFLLRQGIRAADIGRIAGDIPQNELITYMQMHSPTARRPLDQIERVHPGLRELVGIG